MTAAVHAFAEMLSPATRLAGTLGVPCRPISVHHFPDGESLVQVDAPTETVILYRSLDRPNEKLVEILLAASAFRDRGAQQVVLVAPYLAYMRQDCAFAIGQAVSQRVIGRLLADHFDAVVTVDPHLHRTLTFASVIPNRPAVAVSAAPVLVEALRPIADGALLVGPDEEARPWVEAIAAPLGLPVLIGAKKRAGDRSVSIRLPGLERRNERRAIIIDDMISTGVTLCRCATALRDHGVTDIAVAVVHCLAAERDLEALRSARIARIIATDSVPGPHSSVQLCDVLAKKLVELDALASGQRPAS